MKHKENFFEAQLKSLEKAKAKLEAGIEPEPRTRFIVAVSQGKVQQDFERIEGKGQINPSEGFHGKLPTTVPKSMSNS